MNKHISLKEWESILLSYETFTIENEDKLIKEIEEINSRGILKIELLRKEIKITSNSYVGELKLGDFLITIEPKIKELDFIKMFDYTYDFTDLKVLTDVNIGNDITKIKDIIIYKLIIIGREILRYPNKNYEKITQVTSNVKGKINFRDIVKNSGEIHPNISCTYFERVDNNHLNNVVFSIIIDLSYYTDNNYIKSIIRKTNKENEYGFKKVPVNINIIKRLILSLNRLNKRYERFLRLSEMFYEGLNGSDIKYNINTIDGFYINMNKLFQDFLSKFISDNLEGYVLKEEYSLRNMFKYIDNPLSKSNILPRPDFVIFKENEMKYILDAKYRDLWEKHLPREMLYQLSLYSLSGIKGSKSRIIYPSNNKDAKLQVISINNIMSNLENGRVEIQPVFIEDILGIIEGSHRDKRDYVKTVILGTT